MTAPNVCPTCDELLDPTYEDGGGDDGDSIEEVLTCPVCGYELRHTVGSPAYHDGSGYIFFDDEPEDEIRS